MILCSFEPRSPTEVYQAARRGPWKAVRYGMDAKVELYNLDNDPGEVDDLSEQEPEIHRGFVELFDKHKG